MHKSWMIGLGPALMLGACAAPTNPSGEAVLTAQRSGPETGRDTGDVSRSVLREDVINLLVGFTGHENAQVRANAIEALIPVPTRLGTLLAGALVDENAGVRAVAAMAIAKIEACDLVPLTEPLLHDPSPFARLGAIYAQSACDDDRHTGELASMLLNHESIGVRSQAAFILGELGNRSAMALLRQAAGGSAQQASEAQFRLLQLQIAEALAKLGDEGQRDILHAALFVSRAEDLEATALAAQILGEIHSRNSVPELRNLIAYRDERGAKMPAEIRLNAGISLAKLGDLAQANAQRLAALSGEYLDHPSPMLRAQAAILSGLIGRETDVAVLRNMLSDLNPLVQIAAGSGILQASSSGDFAGIRP